MFRCKEGSLAVDIPDDVEKVEKALINKMKINEKLFTSFFDCDGVILNSNKVKTNAFYKIALEYGDESAKKLVNYHIKNGGISRYKNKIFSKEYYKK